MQYKIIIKDLKIFAYHGVKDEEKQNGQEFFIDCTLIINKPKIKFKDNINETISYSEASRFIKKVMTDQKFNLIETAAEKVTRNLFKEFSMIEEIEITLKKPNAPIKDIEFDYMAVNINSRRSDFFD